MDRIGPGIISVIASVIGLAMVAVLVSQNAQTSTVITGAGTALSGIITAAVSPVAGSSTNAFGTASNLGGGTF
jgi:PRD1 phage membrane DNA delivery